MKRDYVIEYNCGIDEELCFNTADAFLDVGIYCNEYDKRAQAESILFACDAFYAIPAIVNIAFACELYLKALILRETSKPSRGHNLSALYDKSQLQFAILLRTNLRTNVKIQCHY